MARLLLFGDKFVKMYACSLVQPDFWRVSKPPMFLFWKITWYVIFDEFLTALQVRSFNRNLFQIG